jgi:hypothetical protein
MANSSGKSKPGANQRLRINPITKQQESVSGTKAGKKRTRTSLNDPLRTHDIHGPVGKKKNRKNQED